MARYVALLRGINVGGKNPILMAGLKACFEEDGFRDVRTYIQSGNVVFSSSVSNQTELTERVERMLRTTFAHYDASVVLRSRAQMRAIVDRAPQGFGTEPSKYRYDVIFLKPPLTAKEAMQSVSMKESVDRGWAANGVVYFSRLTSRATQSRLSRIVSLPIYQQMTLRNWNTTTKLTELMDANDR
ncbi:MAG: DUF1697 domain-containing protein [Actinomycetota bacterium]|nr:DUF1697 domain-containing protein [Actinomycetota bacterium]